MFIKIVILIAIISVLWAIWSYKKLEKRPQVDEAKQELKKGKVIFQDQSSSD